jgi:hypothetical protein
MLLLAVTLACSHKNVGWPSDASETLEDAFVQAEDFGCLTEWEQVGKAWYTNVNGHLDETLEVAADSRGRSFPVGTVVSLFPGEAMVKRHEGFSAETGDWEYLKLSVSRGGTTITDRGPTSVRNPAGTCLSCHALAAEYDYICATGQGCEPFPRVIERRALKLVERDPRCPPT